jgi:hypothetical protein
MKSFSTIMAFAGFMVASTAAQANLLSYGDFQGATKTNAGINLTNNPGNTGDDNLNMWLDGNQWTINTSNSANHFAQHVVTSDSTNLLFQGIDASGLAAGTDLKLSFEYALDSLTQANARSATVVIAGLMNGVHNLDLFAGWFDGGPFFGPDPDDGIVLLQQSFGDNDGVFQELEYMITLGQTFDVLAVGFVFSGPTGDTGLRAVDNVFLDVAVPVPVPLALLAFGLLAVAGVRRARR